MLIKYYAYSSYFILCVLGIQFRVSHTNGGHEIIVEEQLR